MRLDSCIILPHDGVRTHDAGFTLKSFHSLQLELPYGCDFAFFFTSSSIVQKKQVPAL
jgi:hypothetical protein